MRYILTILIALLIHSGYAGCTYTDPTPFPGSLTIKAGDTLCITKDVTVTSSILIRNKGHIMITDAIFRVNGSVTVQGQGLIHINGCDSRFRVWGAYTGASNKCEIYYYCNPCDEATDTPFELIWGTEFNRKWCCQAPLDIELGTFYAEKDGVNNIVYFQTYSEIDVDYFVVQRSKSTFVWTGIDSFPGTNTFYPMWYSTVDRDVNSSYYYRLKEVETAGNVVYHPTIHISRTVAEDKELFRLNILGQHVDATYKGIVFIRYASGRTSKVVQ